MAATCKAVLGRAFWRRGFGVALACALSVCPRVARAQDATQAAGQHDHDQPAADAGDYPSLKIAGFGDVDFSRTSRTEGPRDFSLGQFVLHMSSALSPRVNFFGEISLSARADAGTGTPPAPGFNTEVERMILRFDHSDRLKVSFGRYHTPINWWNTSFHHGQWLQTSIARPEMIQFGGRFLPVHFIGALVEGAMPAGGLNLNYQAGLGNGRSSVISRAGDAGDANNRPAYVANVYSRPNWAYGLQFGGSVYADTITLSTPSRFEERIVTAHAVWLKEDPELIAEVANVRHRDTATGLTTWNHAYYVQGAYRLPAPASLWKPYVRFEHIRSNSADAVFVSVPSLDASTLGLRYDFTLYAAIKGEYRTWTRGPSVPRNHGGFFQLCFTF